MRLFYYLGLYLVFACIQLEAAHFENPVEVSLKVEDASFNFKITELKFNGEDIKLDPSDMFKPRKVMQFKLQPGRYALSWTTERTQTRWSETPVKQHEKIVVLEGGDSLVRINIKGDAITMY